MATLTIEAPRIYSARNSMNPDTIGNVKEADSQTFVAGDLVYPDDSVTADVDNKCLKICGADPAKIGGIALKAATNVTTGNIEIPIEPINSEDTYQMNIYHATPASAILNSVQIGDTYEIIRATVSSVIAWCVDMAATTNIRVIVVGKHPSDAGTDLYGRALVKFLTTDGTNFNMLRFSP